MKLRLTKAVLAAWGMLALILDGQTALTGAAAGLELCIKTVIPSLFPFLFLCAVLTGELWGESFPVLKPLGRRLGIPNGAESLLLAAVLGGYPAGAQQIGEAYRDNRLDKKDAQHLLSFCSNAGPAFLFGMTARQFSGLSIIWALWIIQILSSFLTGALGVSGSGSQATLSGENLSISQILNSTLRAMGAICGWIFLFQILLGFLERWCFWMLPEGLQVFLTGLLELSSGCCALGRIGDEHLRFLLCNVMLSFGGLCVTMQTTSVIRGLSPLSYLRGKGIQTVLSLALGGLYLRFGWLSFCPVFLFFLVPRKKEVDFRENPLYNAAITTGRKNPCCFVKK